jgi:hypothetical protein
MTEEFAVARMALRKGNGSSPIKVAGSAAPDGDETIDNEGRELILLGEFAKLVGESGHIFRPTSSFDWGIDGEVEFKQDGLATGSRVYVQLRSGDSHLKLRSSDTAELFYVKNARHLDYWIRHRYPVMLVIRQSSGLIRWMDVGAYLKAHKSPDRSIVFSGHEVTVESIRALASRLLGDETGGATS